MKLFCDDCGNVKPHSERCTYCWNCCTICSEEKGGLAR